MSKYKSHEYSTYSKILQNQEIKPILSIRKTPNLKPNLLTYNLTNELTILVLSSRHNFAARAAIRHTWAQHSSNVYFFVGEKFCEYPQKFLSNHYECRLFRNYSQNLNILNAQDENLLKNHTHQEFKITQKLKQEAEQFQDLIILPMLDIYHSRRNG